mmetsp:Transcript_7166/g.18209  ORF Transcript_7166/g.18209 Transcript_7166/m.18209 type:complete len:143 (-) Transcript_7166:1477-1905(-)
MHDGIRASDLMSRDSETVSDVLKDLRADTQRIAEAKAAEQLSRLIWVPDQHAQQCGRCEKPFGALTWRHHCRKCGSCVCQSCSPFRQALPRIGYHEPVRICYVCKSDAFIQNRVAAATESGRMDDSEVHVILKGSFSRGTVL